MTVKPSNDIALVDLSIAEFHDEWRTNRAMIAGARKVRAGGELYLPRFPSVDKAQHQAIIERTPFFPGASRTHEGLMGLLFRKPPKVEAPDAYRALLDIITIEGDSIVDLAEDVADETLTINFGIMLTDYPVAPGPMSLAEAIDKGFGPRILLYPGEAILGVETGVVNGSKAPVRIRLQEDAKTIRELVLIAGIYTVNLWRQDTTGDWAIAETIVPTRGAKREPLREIPATKINTGRKYVPYTAPLFDVCDLNKSHFHASSNLATCDYWMSNPTPWTTGTKPSATISIAPGTIWQFEEEGARVGMLEYAGSQAGQLDSRTATIRDYMASAGARILAPEKTAGVESAQALEIRNAAQTATLDGVSAVVEGAINDQLKWVAWWLGLEEGELKLTMSRDFVNAKLGPEERKQIVAEWQAGFYSHETAVDQMKAGNVLAEDYDLEADREIMAQEAADRPPVDAPAVIANDPNAGNDEPA